MKCRFTFLSYCDWHVPLSSCVWLQRSWLITTWAIDEETRLKLYQSIKDINWQTDEFVFTGLNSEPHPMIAAFFASHGRILTLYKMGIYVIDRQAALAIELRLMSPIWSDSVKWNWMKILFLTSSPADVYVKSLETHNAATVYDNWSYNEITTADSVLEGVIASPTAGVFLKDTNKLVCWMTSRVHVGMSQLHTLEEYRRRGYAACVTQYLTKRLAQSGYVPYAIVSPNNEPSVRCFQRAGFRLNSLFHICEVTFPKSNSKH